MKDCTIKVRVYSVEDGPRFTDGQITVQEWDHRDRVRRAAFTWIGCWLFAGISVFLPLLHFILVPAFVIAGPILSSIVYTQERIVLGGDAACPSCKSALKIERGRLHWPLDDLCTECRREVKIVSDVEEID